MGSLKLINWHCNKQLSFLDISRLRSVFEIQWSHLSDTTLRRCSGNRRLHSGTRQLAFKNLLNLADDLTIWDRLSTLVITHHLGLYVDLRSEILLRHALRHTRLLDGLAEELSADFELFVAVVFAGGGGRRAACGDVGDRHDEFFDRLGGKRGVVRWQLQNYEHATTVECHACDDRLVFHATLAGDNGFANSASN